MDQNLKRLLETDRKFSKLSDEKGAPEAFKQFLVSDAIQLPQGMMPVYTAVYISRAVEMGPGEKLVWAPEDGMVAKSGELGFTWGFYKMLAEEKLLFEGKYLNIWVKLKTGEWKVKVDMGNTNKLK